jgi:peptidoglycan/LPS O-acetylase OafA/YrhL
LARAASLLSAESGVHLFIESPRPVTSRMPGLDLLRAIAIVWVMLYHGDITGMMSIDSPFIVSGWMGVDLFFALSGFLIGGQLLRPYARREPEHIGLFYARRLFRTLPPYLVVLALYFLWPDFREQPVIMPPWQFLTFTENLFIDFHGPRAFSHVWSLCVEEQFYLVTPLIAWVLMRRPALWKAVALAVVIVAGGMALRGYIWLHDLAPAQAAHDGTFTRLFMERIYYPTDTRLDGLLAGVLAAAVRAFKPQWWAAAMKQADLVLLSGVGIVLMSMWLFKQQLDFWPTVIGYPILSFGMAMLVAAGSQASSLIGRWRVPGAGLIAGMAYSLYLTHKQVYHLVREHLGAALAGHPLLALVVVVTSVFAVGGLLYVTFERPALILRDRILKRGAVGAPKVAPAQA